MVTQHPYSSLDPHPQADLSRNEVLYCSTELFFSDGVEKQASPD